MPDETRQVEGRTGFHNEAAAGEDKADLCGAVGQADVHGERHGDTDANGGALQSANGGFAAVSDGEGYAAATTKRY